MRKPYPTDLSDAQWARLQSYLPIPKAERRLRTHSLRDVFDAIFYVLKSGCHWRLLPHYFPPWSTVYYHFRRFRSSGLWSLILKGLHAAERKRAGKDPQPTRRPLWIPKASRPSKNRPTRATTTPTRTSKDASGTFWWIPWVFHSRFMSPRPTYKIGSGRSVFWPGSRHCCPT